MVLDLAQVYQQKIDTDTVVTLLGQLGKNLIAMVGASQTTATANSVPALFAGNSVILKMAQQTPLVAERYAEGFDAATPQLGWSMAKSVCHLLTGIVQERGLIDTSQPAPV